MSHNPYSVADRVRLTQKQRVELWLKHKGRCCIDDHAIRGEWIVEHIKPLWLFPEGTPADVANAPDNLGPACIDCARGKTKREAADRAKSRRIVARNIGAWRPKGRPMPGSKRSGWKKKFDGSVERR
jgi:5-methylcytosine-specific restriction protein A